MNETKISNSFSRNKKLDEQLSTMTDEELSKVLMKLQTVDIERSAQILSIDTSRHAKHIVPWHSPAGRAYSKWAADMLSTYPKAISTGDRNFLSNVVMKVIVMNEDNIHHLRWLGGKYKTGPTTGDIKKDAAIWSYIYNYVTWKEMLKGKIVHLILTRDWK